MSAPATPTSPWPRCQTRARPRRPTRRHRRRRGAARQRRIRRARRPRRRAAGAPRRRRGRRRRGRPAEPLELVITLFAAWRLGAAATPVNPALTPRGDAVPDRRRRRQGRDRRRARARRPVVEVGALAEEPSLHAEPVAVRPGRARAADLHQRDDRQAQGRDARPREHRRDVRHDPRRARHHGRGPQPADPAAVSRQRHRHRHPDAAAGRRSRDHRRPLQPEDVLRPRRADPPDVLLGGAGDLRDADLAAGGRDGRHVLAAARGVRRGADAGRS